VQLRQAGRRQDRVGAELVSLEDPGLAGAEVGRGDEQLEAARGQQALEVDQLGENPAQRVEPERVELIGRQQLGGNRPPSG
jgi:hypothetical protein